MDDLTIFAGVFESDAMLQAHHHTASNGHNRFPHFPPEVVNYIENYDWTTRDPGERTAFFESAVAPTVETLDRLCAASPKINAVIEKYSQAGSLDAALSEENLDLADKLLNVFSREGDIQERRYLLLFGALLMEMRSQPDPQMPFSWRLERVTIKSQMLLGENLPHQTVALCETLLKVKRDDYGLDHSARLREAFGAMGNLLPTSAVGFFGVFAEAHRLMENYELAVAVADGILCSDLALAEDNLEAARTLVREQMKELWRATAYNDDGTVTGPLMRHQVALLMSLIETFDLATSQLITEAALSDKGLFRKRRSLIRGATAGLEDGWDIAWGQLETLALYGTRESSLISERCLRGITDDDFAARLQPAILHAVKGWRSSRPKSTWWDLPYPAARSALVAELILSSNLRFGRQRTLHFAEDLISEERGKPWKLAYCLEDAPNPTFRNLADRVANSISLTQLSADDRDDCIDFLMSYLGLEGGGDTGIQEGENIGQYIERRCGIGQDWCVDAFDLFGRLAIVLIKDNRYALGVAILRGLIGLDDPGSSLNTAALDRLLQLDPKSLSTLLAALHQVAIFDSHLDLYRRFFTGLFEIADATWHTPSVIGAVAQRVIREKKLDRRVASSLICGAALCAIDAAGRTEAGIQVLLSYLGVERIEEIHAQELTQKHHPLVWLPIVVDLLTYLEIQSDHLTYLKVVAGLYKFDLDAPVPWLSIGEVPRQVDGFGEYLANETSPHILRGTLIALRAVGRSNEAVELAKGAAELWLNSESRKITTEASCQLALECIRTLIETDAELACKLTFELSMTLRSDHDSTELGAFDRLRLARITMEARHLITDVANTLSLVEPFKESAFIEFIEEEMYLSVQRVIERIRRGIPSQLDHHVGPSFLRGWSISRRNRSRFRDVRRSGKVALALSQVDSPPLRTVTVSEVHSDAETHEKWFREHRWSRQKDAVFGPRSLLLKAGFTLQGQLVWVLLHVNDGRIRVHASGQGNPDARDRLRTSVRRFHRTMDALWDTWQFPTAAWLADRVADLQWTVEADEGTLVSPEEYRADAENRLACLQRFPRTFEQFQLAFGNVSAWGQSGETPYPSVDAWNAWWQETFQLLRQFHSNPADHSRALDQATWHLLDDVADVWRLEPLFSALPGDAELMIEAREVLHSIPLMLLNLHEPNGTRRFLFESVACASVVASPLIDWWQRETLDCPPVRDDKTNHRIASLTWLGRPSPDRLPENYTTYALQRSQAKLAKSLNGGYEQWSSGGSEKSPGSHAVLGRGIRDAGSNGLALLTICGHGFRNTPGIELSDGLWQGREFLERPADDADRWKRSGGVCLKTAHFVILLSCSMGRLSQSPLQDVEGFCVDLIVNEARSVLAGRWALHAVDSIQFAHWVSASYLRRHRHAVRRGLPLWQIAARGKALAAARSHWAKQWRAGQASIGINTVAAMELYGLR